MLYYNQNIHMVDQRRVFWRARVFFFEFRTSSNKYFIALLSVMSSSGGQQQQNSAAAFSAEERKQLNEALRRANQFELAEEMDLMRQPLEGQLMKFTNVVQVYNTYFYFN